MNNYKLKLIDIVQKCANHVSVRHYRSQPMPVAYSHNFGYATGTPQPSQMQEAFMKAFVKASKQYFSESKHFEERKMDFDDWVDELVKRGRN